MKVTNYTKRMVSTGKIYMVNRVIERVIYVGLIPIYTTFLSAKEFGILALLTLTIKLFAIFASSPINSGFIRFYYEPSFENKKRELTFNLFLFAVFKSLFFMLVFLSCRYIFSEFLLRDKTLVHLVNLYSVILFLTPISSFFECILQMLEKAKYFMFVSLTRSIFSAIVAVVLLAVFKLGVYALAFSQLVSLVISIILITPVFMKISSFKMTPQVLKEPLKYSYPLLISGYSNLFIQLGDRYILRLYKSLADVGVYSFGYRFGELIQLLLVMPIKFAFTPLVLQQEKTPSKLKEFIKKSSLQYYLIATGLFLIISMFSKEAIKILARREEFWRGWIIVPFIAFSYLLHGLLNFVSKGITMSKKSWYASFSVIITAIVNIVLNIIFIPIWGIIGAAIATLISYVIWNFLYIYYSAKFYQLYFDLRRLIHITIVGIGLYLLSLLIANTGYLLRDLIIKFFIVLGYPFVLLCTKFFKDEELSFIKNSFSFFFSKLLRLNVRDK